MQSIVDGLPGHEVEQWDRFHRTACRLLRRGPVHREPRLTLKLNFINSNLAAPVISIKKLLIFVPSIRPDSYPTNSDLHYFSVTRSAVTNTWIIDA